MWLKSATDKMRVPKNNRLFFSGGGSGRIAYQERGERGRWHDKFYIPDGETMTLSKLRAINHKKEAGYWGHALDDFAKWYIENINLKFTFLKV